mmetsp:Transcript_18606/g.38330  ORF Transcript_18606/g.38330 Transcript_18606/m.38330 type:complete len:119 (-) Transcript_18606:95-451(-)
MKTAILLSLIAGSQAFAPVARPSVSTALFAEGEIKDIKEKWTEVRRLTREEAKEQLDGEWLEAHTRFFDQYDSDMERMEEIVTKLEKQIEQPRIQKKTKGQKRRDAFARKIERSGQAA